MEEEQRLFRRLAVFAGGCTLEAAEEVCGADLDSLQSLVEKSQLRFTGERYWMLETIREYASERLDACGDSAHAQQRHATYFLAFAEAKGVRGAFEAHVDELDRDHDNLRTALMHFQRSSDSASELRLATALARLWYRGGHFREGMRRLNEVLSRANDDPWEIACEAHFFAAGIASELGDPESAEIHGRAELEIARRFGGGKEIADALLSLGSSAASRGEHLEARHRLEEALKVSREIQHLAGVTAATVNLAELALSEGDFDRAVELGAEASELSREAGWNVGLAHGFVNLALARLSQGRIADALVAIREATELIAAHEFPQVTAVWLEAAGRFLAPTEVQTNLQSCSPRQPGFVKRPVLNSSPS